MAQSSSDRYHVQSPANTYFRHPTYVPARNYESYALRDSQMNKQSAQWQHSPHQQSSEVPLIQQTQNYRTLYGQSSLRVCTDGDYARGPAFPVGPGLAANHPKIPILSGPPSYQQPYTQSYSSMLSTQPSSNIANSIGQTQYGSENFVLGKFQAENQDRHMFDRPRASSYGSVSSSNLIRSPVQLPAIARGMPLSPRSRMHMSKPYDVVPNASARPVTPPPVRPQLPPSKSSSSLVTRMLNPPEPVSRNSSSSTPISDARGIEPQFRTMPLRQDPHQQCHQSPVPMYNSADVQDASSQFLRNQSDFSKHFSRERVKYDDYRRYPVLRTDYGASPLVQSRSQFPLPFSNSRQRASPDYNLEKSQQANTINTSSTGPRLFKHASPMSQVVSPPLNVSQTNDERTRRTSIASLIQTDSEFTANTTPLPSPGYVATGSAFPGLDAAASQSPSATYKQSVTPSLVNTSSTARSKMKRKSARDEKARQTETNFDLSFRQVNTSTGKSTQSTGLEEKDGAKFKGRRRKKSTIPLRDGYRPIAPSPIVSQSLPAPSIGALGRPVEISPSIVSETAETGLVDLRAEHVTSILTPAATPSPPKLSSYVAFTTYQSVPESSMRSSIQSAELLPPKRNSLKTSGSMSEESVVAPSFAAINHVPKDLTPSDATHTTAPNIANESPVSPKTALTPLRTINTENAAASTPALKHVQLDADITSVIDTASNTSLQPKFDPLSSNTRPSLSTKDAETTSLVEVTQANVPQFPQLNRSCADSTTAEVFVKPANLVAEKRLVCQSVVENARAAAPTDQRSSDAITESDEKVAVEGSKIPLTVEDANDVQPSVKRVVMGPKSTSTPIAVHSVHKDADGGEANIESDTDGQDLYSNDVPSNLKRKESIADGDDNFDTALLKRRRTSLSKTVKSLPVETRAKASPVSNGGVNDDESRMYTSKSKFKHNFSAEAAFAELLSAAVNLRKAINLSAPASVEDREISDTKRKLEFTEIALHSGRAYVADLKLSKDKRELSRQPWLRSVIKGRAELSSKHDNHVLRLRQWLKWWWTDIAARHSENQLHGSWGKRTQISKAWQAEYDVSASIVHARLRQCERVYELQDRCGWPALVLATMATPALGPTQRIRKSHLERGCDATQISQRDWSDFVALAESRIDEIRAVVVAQSGYDGIRRILEKAAITRPFALQNLPLFPPYNYAEDADTIVVMPKWDYN
ncbi:hypothetical protein V1512DRAFT_262053 [Lipomyces arxii]|uniref:uncharacterized protein n=1 Tax=Lipomyces arxii TaxID=56418 RepID=UPI0034CF9B85